MAKRVVCAKVLQADAGLSPDASPILTDRAVFHIKGQLANPGFRQIKGDALQGVPLFSETIKIAAVTEGDAVVLPGDGDPLSG